MKRTRVWIAAGTAAMGLTILVLISQPSKKQDRTAPSVPTFDIGIPTAQEVRNMLGVYGERVEMTERDLKGTREELEEIKKQLQSLSTNRKEDFLHLEKLLRPELPEPPSPPSLVARFRTFDFPRETQTAKALHIPAGSFGEATLLTGVYAPISGEALPVLLRLEAALVGPSSSRVPIHGAHLVGKAVGDANSRRAVIQLETLSWVTTSGESVEVKVNGWVVDQDGLQGLDGTYVWRSSEILALAGAGGGLAAAADAMSMREAAQQLTPLGGSTSIVTGDPLKYAGYRGLGGGLGRLADLAGKRLDEITPAIHVTNGKIVTVAFVTGATLEGTNPVITNQNPFEGLDHE